MGLSLYGPPAGRCQQCGRATQLSTGSAEKRATDFGETFPSRYCCRNCLGEHGATEHVRIRHSELDAEGDDR